MTQKYIIQDLIKAQDVVRRGWAEFSNMPVGKELREIDRFMTNVINRLGEIYEEENKQNN